MSLQNMYELLGMDMYSMYPQLAALHGLYPPNHLHVPLGTQPASLNMMTPATAKHQQNTGTVSPLTSPTNCVKSFSSNTSLNASRTSSFAAALRKLAIQAKDPPEDNKVSALSSPRDTTSKSVSPPLLYNSMSLTSPPVVTIAPTQSHRALTSNDSRPTIERLHSNSSLFKSAVCQADRPHSSASRDEDRALSMENHYQYSRRQTPHSTTGASSPMCVHDESKRGFQLYRSVDEMRPPLPASLVLDQTTAAAAYSYPAAFLPPHTFPHPAFRFNDPFLMERYRMMHSACLSYPKGMMAHPSLHPLLAADAYFAPDMFSPHFAAFSQPSRIPEHRSPSTMFDRQQRTEEERLEREKEHEKEYEMAIQQDRQRTLEREKEKQERDKQVHKNSHTGPSSNGGKDNQKGSLSSKFGSVIHGTQKGLGIADRYPRVAMSSSSLNLSRKVEKRHSKDDGNSHSEPSSPKCPSEDQDCLFSQVNPLRDGKITTRSHPTPLVSPQSQEETGPQSSKVSENSLFRPFGSQQLANGLKIHSTDRKENILIYQSDTGKRQYLDSKNTETRSDKDSANDSKTTQSSSAFHSVKNHSPKSDSSSDNLLHYVSQDLSPSISQRSYSTPINVPSYSASHLHSANHKDKVHVTLMESQNCIRKLDVNEQHHSESQADKSSCCCDSELDFNGEEQGEGKKLMISSEHALKQDNSPTKIILPSHPGLSTFSRKKDFEKCHKRRRCTSGKSVSPVAIDKGQTVSSPLKSRYASEDLCKEPDFNQKCHFLSRQFSLEPVTAETKKVKEIILQACVEEKHRRLNLDEDPMNISIIDRFGVKRKLDVYAWHENVDDRNQAYDPRLGGFQKRGLSANSRNFTHSSSAGDTSKVELNLWNNESLSVVNTNFVQEFHDSVLQTTRQKEVKRTSDGLGVPAHNSLTRHMLPWLPPGLDTWPGVDVVMETYQKHDQGVKLEKHVLEVRNRQLKAENCHLNHLASHLSQRMEDMIHKKQQLEELRTHNQERIDHLKNAIRVLK